MNSDTKKNTKFHGTFIFAEITDFAIGIFSNLITQEPFNLFSTKNLVLGGILACLVIAHICCSISQYHSSTKTKNKRLRKAFQKHGGYDVLAEGMVVSLKERDFETFKNLKKMADLVER